MSPTRSGAVGQAAAQQATAPVLWLAAAPVSVGLARRATRMFLAAAGYADPDDTLALLVSEMATNAVRVLRDSSASFGLGLRVVEPGRVRASVYDLSPQPVGPVPSDPHPLDEAGRGLILVNLLADSWAVVAGERGKAVWVEVGLTRPGA